MKQSIPATLLFILFSVSAISQTIVYDDRPDQEGFVLKSQSPEGLRLSYSIGSFTMEDMAVNGEAMKHIALPDHFLPNDEGAPDLPGSGRYVAVPRGAMAEVKIVSVQKEVYRDVNVSPAPRIPKATEEGPLEYNKNGRIYEANAFYPDSPVRLSDPTVIRGVDAVILGITPFQYNPVTRELIVYRDMTVEIQFTGGDGRFGEEKYRSRWWDPILSDIFINASSLPEVDYSERVRDISRSTGCEYLIIAPDDPVFLAWADSIRIFRTLQGILTGVATTSEIGGNTTTAIENYVNNAYLNWDIPPAAILLLGDYGTAGSTIISPIWDDYCVSDHLYADVNADDEEEIVFARMTARNGAELEVMVHKALDYERNPPTNPGFYDHPVTALGWQTERWFQICSEVVGGYFKHVKGKDPVRVNAVYGGNPNTDPWSTATNTETVLGVFGPGGLDYIPASPDELGGWSGGTADMVNDAVNAGAFLLQHRDHGYEYGWGEPDYSNTSIDGLTNTDLCFIFSINCLTGKYNYGDECFAEKFHRYTYNGQPAGALGLLAASEVSYSFVNDAFVWGVFDNLYPDFMPQFGSTPTPRGELPAFGNSAGKYFLKYSSWPYNTGDKEVTYNLFHHHGDAFTCLYSEVPQELTVVHDAVQLAGLSTFQVQANEGALIALSVNGSLIGVATGTGSPVDIEIVPQNPPDVMDVVVTGQNYYRYHARVQVIPPDGPFVVAESCIIDDQDGNNNGLLEYGETVKLDVTFKNLGTEDAYNVIATITCADEYITLADNLAEPGNIPSSQTATVTGAYTITAAGNIPNNRSIRFDMLATDGDTVWNSLFTVRAYAPVLEYMEFIVSDPGGNNDGHLDPGETADLTVIFKNKGAADAYQVYGLLSADDEFVQILSDSVMAGLIGQNATDSMTFRVTSEVTTPPGHQAEFNYHLAGDLGVGTDGSFGVTIGSFPVLILDIDNNHNSGVRMQDALEDVRIFSEYVTEIPQDLSRYRAIFLCLGTYSSNHLLTASEAQPFADYLTEGGNLYMEGADTWYYDSQTSLHSLFNIVGLADGTGDLGTVKGTAGTFAEGLSYSFTGENSWIDHISPVSPAFTILSNLNPGYNVAIAHDAGVYRTIGASFEFGGLADNASSTKEGLMLKYLEFFGMQPVTEKPATPEGDTLVCGTSASSIYHTGAISGAVHYIWQISPAGAGTVEGWDTAVTVHWSPGYYGPVSMKVHGINPYGQGPESEELPVYVHPLPTATISLDASTICPGDTAYMDITLTGTPPWHLEMMVGGTPMAIDPDSPAVEDIPLFPASDAELIITSLTDGTGCMETVFEAIVLTVIPLPEIPGKPAGPEYVDLLAGSESVYATTGSPQATGYEWNLDPPSAGTLMPEVDGTGCTVSWIAPFTGQAVLKVRSFNHCGESAYSELLPVQVVNTFGLEENTSGLSVSLYPNPGRGNFRLELQSENFTKATISVLNAAGEEVMAPTVVNVARKLLLPVRLENASEGLYLLRVVTGKEILTCKIIIGK